jgi:transcriptional regulator with XRE-family HTH domain
MNEENFAARLSQLRQQKGCSARDMSLSIGQSESYINKIENKRTFPSMPTFFYICDFLGVTARDFFDGDNKMPGHLNELIKDLKRLDANALTHIAGIVKEIISKK